MSEPSHEAAKPQARPGWVRRNIVKFVIILAVVGVLAGINAVPPRNRDVPPGEAAPVNVKVMEVVAMPKLADSFTLPAVIEPNRVVTVSAEVAARIERIPLEEGDTVHAGDLLVQLNSDLIEPPFHTAEAQYQRDQIEYSRMEALVKENATSRQDLDNATTKLAASKAALDEARARLDRVRIVSPVDGVLNKLPVEAGEYVQGGTAVAEVVEIDTVKVRVDVPERDIAFFSVGDTARILPDPRDPNNTLSGTITYIDQLANPQTRTTSLEITLDNRQRLLRSGQIVRAQMTRRTIKDAIMIPLLAVIPMEEGYSVYVANGDAAERRDVTFDLIKGDSVRVLTGLKPGDQLLVSGHRLVAPGQKIKVVSES